MTAESNPRPSDVHLDETSWVPMSFFVVALIAIAGVSFKIGNHQGKRQERLDEMRKDMASIEAKIDVLCENRDGKLKIRT